MSSLRSDDGLRGAFKRLSEAAPQSPRRDVEIQLRAAFRSRVRRRRASKWMMCAAAGLAACLAIAVWLANRRPHARADDVYSQFVALPYGESGVPMEGGVIVRVNLSPRQLEALGVTVSAGAGHPRTADLLIAQDGVARAIRLPELSPEQ